MGKVPGRVVAWTALVLIAALVLISALVSTATTSSRVATPRPSALSGTIPTPTTSTTTSPTPTTTSSVPAGRIFDIPFAPILMENLSATRTCSARDLRASVAGTNGATGHSVTYVDLTDISSTSCRLEGYPRVEADMLGHVPVVAGDGGGFFTAMAVDPAVVGPGMAIELSLGTERDCPARYAEPDVYPTMPSDGISIGVPEGSLFVADDLDVLCGLTISPYVQPAPDGPLPAGPPAFALQPEIEAPTTVAAGSPVTFTVVLQNLSAHPVSLSPCPWFTEAIGTGPLTSLSYVLNCAAAPAALEPGDAVVLLMELSAPPTQGQDSLLWMWGAPFQEGGQTMEGPTEPQTGTTLRVTAP